MFKIANDLSGDLNTGIYFPSADTIAFTEGGAEAMRISTDGFLGIGTTAPQAILHTIKTDAANPTIGAFLQNANNTTGTEARLAFSANTNAIASDRHGHIGYINTGGTTGGAFTFATNTAGSPAAERMRIDSSGNVLIAMQNFANAPSASNFGISLNNVNVGSYFFGSSTGVNTHIVFGNPNGQVGSIQTNGSATSYNTSSDYRLKENVNYNFDATTRLKQLKPARFNFIADANKTVDGFLAHEVQDVIPEAITGIKDETLTKEKVVVNSNGRVIAENIEQADWEAGKIPNEEGTSQYPVDSTWEASKVVPVYQGIDQAKLTPILTKALQEAIAKIEQLEATLTSQQTKIDSLEARLTALES